MGMTNCLYCVCTWFLFSSHLFRIDPVIKLNSTVRSRKGKFLKQKSCGGTNDFDHFILWEVIITFFFSSVNQCTVQLLLFFLSISIHTLLHCTGCPPSFCTKVKKIEINNFLFELNFNVPTYPPRQFSKQRQHLDDL